MYKILSAALCASLLLTACGRNDDGPDATGVFETTETTVAARVAGELVKLDVEEGRTLAAGQAVGLVDTMQLHLKKRELMARLRTADSRRYDVRRQLASLRQQIATERRERRRYEGLVARGAANTKQLDDIDARIAVREATPWFSRALGVELSLPDTEPLCTVSGQNTACIGEACPYYA